MGTKLAIAINIAIFGILALVYLALFNILPGGRVVLAFLSAIGGLIGLNEQNAGDYVVGAIVIITAAVLVRLLIFWIRENRFSDRHRVPVDGF